MKIIRTYWVPGEFYEANPESSARYTGTITLHVEADSPPFLALDSSGGITRGGGLGPPRSGAFP
jgi:hypothetical protein